VFAASRVEPVCERRGWEIWEANLQTDDLMNIKESQTPYLFYHYILRWRRGDA